MTDERAVCKFCGKAASECLHPERRKPTVKWEFGYEGFRLGITGSVPGVSLTFDMPGDAARERIFAEMTALEDVLLRTWEANYKPPSPAPEPSFVYAEPFGKYR